MPPRIFRLLKSESKIENFRKSLKTGIRDLKNGKPVGPIWVYLKEVDFDRYIEFYAEARRPRIRTSVRSNQLQRALFGCDIDTIDLAFKDIVDSKMRTTLEQTIPGIKEFMQQAADIATKKAILQQQTKEIEEKLMDIVEPLEEPVWNRLLKAAQLNFSSADLEPQATIVLKLIRNYFRPDHARLFSSTVEEWKELYQIDPFPIIEQLIKEGYLLRENEYECPYCADGDIIVEDDKTKGSCNHCDQTVNIDGLIVASKIYKVVAWDQNGEPILTPDQKTK